VRRRFASCLAVTAALFGCYGSNSVLRSDAGALVDGAVTGGDGGSGDAGGAGLPPRPELGGQIDRVGRPMVSTLFLQPFADPGARDSLRSAYNGAPESAWEGFGGEIRTSLGAFDALNVTCGDQFLADPGAMGAARYDRLAQLFVDDRLWVNSASTNCRFFLGVELAATVAPSLVNDCGGRTPGQDVVDPLYSLVTRGMTMGLSDGIDGDSTVHSTTDFPFLAP
jgi:hypothetical protein